MYLFRSNDLTEADPLLPKNLDGEVEKSDEHKAKDFQLIRVPKSESTVSYNYMCGFI